MRLIAEYRFKRHPVFGKFQEPRLFVCNCKRIMRFSGQQSDFAEQLTGNKLCQYVFFIGRKHLDSAVQQQIYPRSVFYRRKDGFTVIKRRRPAVLNNFIQLFIGPA